MCRETWRTGAGERSAHAESDQAISLYLWLHINKVLHNHNAPQVQRHTPLRAMMLHSSESRTGHPECASWTITKTTNTHMHINHVASHISGLPSDTLSPSTPCVLLRPLSAVTDRMTGRCCCESCLGWWPHSWIPPAPHLGKPAASQASQTRRWQGDREKDERRSDREAEIPKRLFKIGGHWIWMCDSQV